MINDFLVDNIQVKVYQEEFISSDFNIIYIPCFFEEIEELTNYIQKNNLLKNNIYVFFYGFNWNNDLTPYATEFRLKNGEPFKGNAPEFLKIIENKLVNTVKNELKNTTNYRINNSILIGYSLAGLFAIFSGIKSSSFTKIGSVSGSLWYPNFMDFVKENKFDSAVKSVYFSLGDKENKTANEVMKTVKENSIGMKTYCESQGINTIFEENKGNHFKDSSLRIIKAIKWLLAN